MSMSKLNVGDRLPDFNTVDHNGNQVSNETLNGKKTVIYFYPKDMTPGCTTQACNIRDNYDTLLLNNFNVIGISPDDTKSHHKFADKFSLPFPLISDTDKHLADLFGVWGPKKFMGKVYDGINRTTFVTNEELIITEIIDKVDTKNHVEQIIK
jgi:thioredoxin-dependent peroxiredoxin